MTRILKFFAALRYFSYIDLGMPIFASIFSSVRSQAYLNQSMVIILMAKMVKQHLS